MELELQSKTGSFGGGEVFLCPTLCVSDPNEHKYRNNVVKAKHMSYFDRCRTLAFLQEKPTIEVCGSGTFLCIVGENLCPILAKRHV